MENLAKITQNFYKPRWWKDTAIPHARTTMEKEISKIAYSPNQEPVSIMAEDWDQLLILDACRYDLFEEVNTLPGRFTHRISPASATPEFLSYNFEGETYYDTVYVTANPMYLTESIEDTFYDCVDVWRTSWDSDKHTVHPEDMAEATLTAKERYPNKRIISHFNQPHYPFIGEKGEEVGQHAGSELTYRKATGKEAARDYPTVWQLLEDGEVTEELAWEAYRENLKLALPHVETLLENFGGKSVVTSDHGNLFGETPFYGAKPRYGHPLGFRSEHLCKVPWLVYESGTRREIIAEEPSKCSSNTSELVSERLADLGYIDN